MSESWFTSHDDVNHYLASYDDWIQLAQIYGRVQHIMNGIYVQALLIFDSFIYYRWLHIISIISMILAFGWLVLISYKNRYMGYAYMVILATLWQNSAGHNMIGSYPFYVAFTTISLLLTIIFLIRYLQGKGSYHIYASLLFWILTLKGSELWILYLPLIILFAYIYSEKQGFIDKIIDSVKISKWHILLTILSVSIYFAFKIHYGGNYDGSKVSLPSLYVVLNAWWKYTLALTPGLRFYYLLQDFGIYELLNLINFQMIFLTVSVFVVLVSLRQKMANVTLSSRAYVMTFVIAIYTLIVPNFLISLTHKYQVWALGYRIRDYLYSSLSYFSIAFLIFIVLFVLRRWRYPYIFMSIIISLLALVTSINNRYIGDLFEADAKRFFLTDALIASKYMRNIPKGYTVLSPTLFGGMVTSEDELNSFYKKRKKVDIHFIKDGDANASIRYLGADSNKENSFLLFSENSMLKSIFVSSKKCNNISPCYIVYASQHFENKNLLKVRMYKMANSLFVHIDKLSDGVRYKNITMYEPSYSIDSDKIVSIVDYDPKNIYKEINYAIEFLSGLYSWEGGIGHFVWSSGNVKVKLNNYAKTPQDYKFSLKLGTLKARNVSFILNGSLIKKINLLVGQRGLYVPMKLKLKSGANILDIVTDTPAARPGNGDKREMTFSMSDIDFQMPSSDISK